MREALVFPGSGPSVSRVIPPMREDSPMSKLSLMMALAAICATGVAAPASAQDGERATVSVRYDDLNLSSAAGRERLDTRMRVAIRKMCDAGPSATLRQRAAASECTATAKRSIEPQVAGLLNGSTAKFASERPPVVAAP